MGIVNALADDNIQVTMVSPFKPSKVRENVHEVVFSGGDLSRQVPNLFTGNKMTAPMTMMKILPGLCVDALGTKEVQNLLKEDFDLVLLSVFVSECFLSAVHQMKVSPAGLLTPAPSIIGNTRFPSYDASFMLDFKHPMTFMERAISTLSDVAMDAMLFYYLSPRMESECRRRGLCPDDMPSLSEIGSNASHVLINSVQTIDYPARPYVPAVVHCGGIHLRPAQPLSQELEDWVQDAGDAGFIFFSLGSAVTPPSMPEQFFTSPKKFNKCLTLPILYDTKLVVVHSPIVMVMPRSVFHGTNFSTHIVIKTTNSTTLVVKKIIRRHICIELQEYLDEDFRST
ncbi:UDP-glucosyltransferase 2-like [Cherax quadricarinatus]|uniref:UDP-glucosyltransferase 2-like n=1 Tax=Cherax quadricarinatus TaxID=27406 RepID=UPI00387ECBB8